MEHEGDQSVQPEPLDQLTQHPPISSAAIDSTNNATSISTAHPLYTSEGNPTNFGSSAVSSLAQTTPDLGNAPQYTPNTSQGAAADTGTYTASNTVGTAGECVPYASQNNEALLQQSVGEFLPFASPSNRAQPGDSAPIMHHVQTPINNQDPINAQAPVSSIGVEAMPSNELMLSAPSTQTAQPQTLHSPLIGSVLHMDPFNTTASTPMIDGISQPITGDTVLHVEPLIPGQHAPVRMSLDTSTPLPAGISLAGPTEQADSSSAVLRHNDAVAEPVTLSGPEMGSQVYAGTQSSHNDGIPMDTSLVANITAPGISIDTPITASQLSVPNQSAANQTQSIDTHLVQGSQPPLIDSSAAMEASNTVQALNENFPVHSSTCSVTDGLAQDSVTPAPAIVPESIEAPTCLVTPPITLDPQLAEPGIVPVHAPTHSGLADKLTDAESAQEVQPSALDSSAPMGETVRAQEQVSIITPSITPEATAPDPSAVVQPDPAATDIIDVTEEQGSPNVINLDGKRALEGTRVTKRKRALVGDKSPPQTAADLLNAIQEKAYSSCEWPVDRAVELSNNDCILVPAFVDTDPANHAATHPGVHEQILWRWDEKDGTVRTGAMKLCHELQQKSDMDTAVFRQLQFSLQRLADHARHPSTSMSREILVQLQVSVRHKNSWLRDVVLWDVAQPYNTPEMYASVISEELGLRCDWFTSIADHVKQLLLDIREEIVQDGLDAVKTVSPEACGFHANGHSREEYCADGFKMFRRPTILEYCEEEDPMITWNARYSALREKWHEIAEVKRIAQEKIDEVRRAEQAKREEEEKLRLQQIAESQRVENEKRRVQEEEEARKRAIVEAEQRKLQELEWRRQEGERASREEAERKLQEAAEAQHREEARVRAEHDAEERKRQMEIERKKNQQNEVKRAHRKEMDRLEDERRKALSQKSEQQQRLQKQHQANMNTVKAAGLQAGLQASRYAEQANAAKTLAYAQTFVAQCASNTDTSRGIQAASNPMNGTLASQHPHHGQHQQAAAQHQGHLHAASSHSLAQASPTGSVFPQRPPHHHTPHPLQPQIQPTHTRPVYSPAEVARYHAMFQSRHLTRTASIDKTPGSTASAPHQHTGASSQQFPQISVAAHNARRTQGGATPGQQPTNLMYQQMYNTPVIRPQYHSHSQMNSQLLDQVSQETARAAAMAQTRPTSAAYQMQQQLQQQQLEQQRQHQQQPYQQQRQQGQ